MSLVNGLGIQQAPMKARGVFGVQESRLPTSSGPKGCPPLPLAVLEEIAGFLIKDPYVVVWEAMELHDVFYEGHTKVGYNRAMWFALFDRLGVV